VVEGRRPAGRLGGAWGHLVSCAVKTNPSTKSAGALLGALAIGSLTAILSSVLVARSLGGGRELWLSMAPKSATAAISMAIAGRIGGIPALTAVLTISTGIMGACLAGYVLRLAGVKEWHARGFAMGLSSHGIATARAFQESEIAGTFAGLAMGAERHCDCGARAVDHQAARPRWLEIAR
jgi:putative effector of murein hydrolase